jgi:hypothetical protein
MIRTVGAFVGPSGKVEALTRRFDACLEAIGAQTPTSEANDLFRGVGRSGGAKVALLSLRSLRGSLGRDLDRKVRGKG